MPHDNLGTRIENARSKQNAAQQTTQPQKQTAAHGLTMASEFICAILVGTTMGWALDNFTALPAPFGMIAGTFTGFTAGVTMMIRHQNRSQKPDRNPQ